MQENRSNVPNFGTEEETTEVDEEEQKEEKWDLSGTINQCIQRYAAQLTEEQINEILLGLENGLTEEEVKKRQNTRIYFVNICHFTHFFVEL